MRSWTPKSLYDAKPWAFMGLGAVLALGMAGWSLSVGYWTWWRGLSLAIGAALGIIGGATLQMRQDYRARSKWRRETRR
jgi:hypothetical protein